MRWEDTVASNCRYGDVLAPLFEGGDVIWENSEDYYQGFANVLVAMPDGKFIHYEWTYGSCSGCDEWEGLGLSDKQIREEATKEMAVLKTKDTLKRYLKLEDEFKDAKVPTANTMTNGGLPGMLRGLGCGSSQDFKAMGEAVKVWLETN